MKSSFLSILFLSAFVFANGQTISNFRLKNVNNEIRSFSELKGEKLTIIDFWATWCKPCNKAIPELNKIYSSFSDRGLQIIGISCDGPRSISKVAPMVSSLQIKYPVLTDINSDVMNGLSLTAFPTLILVNSSGKVVWIHEGFTEGDEKLIISEIEKHLNAGKE